MTIRRLLLTLCCALALAACGTDTAGGVAGENDDDNAGTVDMGPADITSPDTGGDADEQEDMPPSEVSCDDDGDCTPPDVCVFDLSTGEGTCGDPNGPGQTGDMCTTGDDCASGLCINGLCADPCSAESDCPAGFTCQSTDVSLEDGSTVAIDVCVPEVTPCASSSDCSDPDVCVVDRSGDDVSLECDTPVGGGTIGDACTDDADCESNLCLDDVCSAPCETSNDCATDGSFVCESESLSTDTGGTRDVTVCKPRPPETCLSDGDCSGGERCVATKTATDVEFACGMPNAGGGESGENCNGDVDCVQNLCVDGACAGPCQVVGDCGGAPMRCEVTMVDLGNGNSDSAQICLLPVPCEADDECRTAMGEVCYLRQLQSGVDAICRAPNPTGGTLGQRCDLDDECANNLCLATRFRDVCAPPCVDDADCNVSGYECGTTTFDLAGGGTATFDTCVPETPPTCTSNDDCGTGLECVIIENEAGTGLETVCLPTTGGDATGVPCTANEDCASLLCLNNFCSTPCDDSTQCSQGQLCQTNNVDKNGVTGDLDVCETLPDTQCTSSDDCTDGLRVCGDVRDNMGTAEAYCTFPNSGASQLGATCTVGTDCRENICLAGLSDECSVVCDKDGDCAATQECTTFGDLNYCNTACGDNADCGAPDRYCTLNGDEITDEVDQICWNPIGTGVLGEMCATGGDCVNGFCLRSLLFTGTACTDDSECAFGESCECPIDQPNCTTGKECASVERRCSALCNDQADCTGNATNPLTACSPDIYVQRPSGAFAQISGCARP